MIEISGVAMTEGPTDNPSLPKYIPADELEASANGLIDCPVYRQGERTVEATIGEVTSAQYRRGELIFTAELFDDELAGKVQAGEADARAIGRHAKDLERNEDGQRIVSDLDFHGLSIKEIDSDVEAAQLATLDKRTPPPKATMDAYDTESTAFALSAEIDDTMTESITIDETTHSQLLELRSSLDEFDDNTPMNDVISYVASEAGAPTEGEVEAAQSRLIAEHTPAGSDTSEELSNDTSGSEELTDEEQIKAEQERLRDKMFGDE